MQADLDVWAIRRLPQSRRDCYLCLSVAWPWTRTRDSLGSVSSRRTADGGRLHPHAGVRLSVLAVGLDSGHGHIFCIHGATQGIWKQARVLDGAGRHRRIHCGEHRTGVWTRRPGLLTDQSHRDCWHHDREHDASDRAGGITNE